MERSWLSPMARKTAIMLTLLSYISLAGRGMVAACRSAMQNSSFVEGGAVSCRRFHSRNAPR